ncbi:MAG: SAM-dependent methyltransferase [Planctomycetota bacterium]
MAEPPPDARTFVSRGGLKLDAALEAFGLDATGKTCVDLGCSTGGFVDCLLHRGAAHVFAVDTAYGELAWKLRQDDRVTVMERTNALHTAPPPNAKHRCDLVTLDLGWTKQDKALPATLPWLATDGAVVTLIKPHYESGQHRLSDEDAKRITDDVVAKLPEWGWTLNGLEPSSVRGGKGKNLEYLAWLTRK